MIIKMFEHEPDIDEMNEQELRDYLAVLYSRIAEHDKSEPEDLESEEYESWGDARETLEDLVDDVLDRLDEVK